MGIEIKVIRRGPLNGAVPGPKTRSDGRQKPGMQVPVDVLKVDIESWSDDMILPTSTLTKRRALRDFAVRMMTSEIAA